MLSHINEVFQFPDIQSHTDASDFQAAIDIKRKIKGLKDEQLNENSIMNSVRNGPKTVIVSYKYCYNNT